MGVADRSFQAHMRVRASESKTSSGRNLPVRRSAPTPASTRSHSICDAGRVHGAHGRVGHFGSDAVTGNESDVVRHLT